MICLAVVSLCLSCFYSAFAHHQKPGLSKTCSAVCAQLWLAVAVMQFLAR